MKTMYFIILIVLSIQSVQGQSYSGWLSAEKNRNLKMRWATKKDSENHSYILIQFLSSVACRFYVTASLCDKDAKDINGWKPVHLTANKLSTYSFKMLNTCSAGFWWWYKNYNTSSVKYDDN